MIVHGRAMKTPQYTHEQLMETTMLRRSIKDDSVNYNNVSSKLGYEYTRYGTSSPITIKDESERVGG